MAEVRTGRSTDGRTKVAFAYNSTHIAFGRTKVRPNASHFAKPDYGIKRNLLLKIWAYQKGLSLGFVPI